MQLQSIPPGFCRRIAGRCLVGLLAASAIFGTLAARAGQGATAPAYAVAMTIDAGGRQSATRVLAREGEQFAIATGPWRVEMTVRAAPTAGSVWVAGRVYKDDMIVGTPTLLARANEQIGVKVGDAVNPFAFAMVVTPQP